MSVSVSMNTQFEIADGKDPYVFAKDVTEAITKAVSSVYENYKDEGIGQYIGVTTEVSSESCLVPYPEV